MTLSAQVIAVAKLPRMDSSEFHAALAEVQNIIGQDDGGLAGVIFSGMEDSWKEMSVSERAEFVSNYVQKELQMLCCSENSEEVTTDVEAELSSAIKNGELGDIRSILDEHKHPCEDPQKVIDELDGSTDANWDYCPSDGWSYEEY